MERSRARIPTGVATALVAASVAACVAIGYLAVRRDTPTESPRKTAPPDAIEEAPRSQRVAIPGTASPAPEVSASEPDDRVDSELAAWNRQALAALDAGDHARAVALLEDCHRADPAQPILTANLAEALSRLSMEEFDRGTVESRTLSLEHLERARHLAPERDDLRQRADHQRRLSASEKDLWIERSEHFELAYDGERTDLLWSSYQITQVLESAYQDIGESFGTFPVEAGRARIRVVLYRREGFHSATGIGHWAGGLFDGMIRVPLEDLGRERAHLERTLRHELVHAFVAHAGGKRVPGWLNEGLAQWLSDPYLPSRARDVQRAREKLKASKPLALAELRDSLSSHAEPERIAVAYAQALALVDHLDRSYGEAVLFAMVAAERSSKTCEEVFRQRTGVDLEVAMQDLFASL